MCSSELDLCLKLSPEAVTDLKKIGNSAEIANELLRKEAASQDWASSAIRDHCTAAQRLLNQSETAFRAAYPRLAEEYDKLEQELTRLEGEMAAADLEPISP